MKGLTLKLKYTALAVLAAAAFTACQDEPAGEGNGPKISIVRPVTFNICEVQTRASFGQGQDGIYPTLWTSKDSFIKLAVNYSAVTEAAVVPSENFRTASFTADIDASAFQAPYTFYAVSPASAAKALSPSRQAWNVTIPSVQTPLEGSVDEAAMLLAAASQPSDAIPQNVDIHFNHLTAYGRMSFTNLDLGDAVVEKVEITATTPFVGDWYWDCAEEHAITDNGASSTLSLITGSTADVWFACAPVDMSGQIMVFTVYTDKGSFVKEVMVPDGRRFTAGHIAVFNVDMSGIEPVMPVSTDFVLITSESELHDGDELLILDAGEAYTISTEQKTNNRAAVAVSVDGHRISELPEDAQVLTLEAGTTSGTWYLNTGSGYLANGNGNNNRLVTVESVTGNATWTISVASSGEATVKAGAGQRNLLRFNDSNQANLLFSCYASGQNDIVIYRRGGSSVPGSVNDDPFAQYSEYGIYLSSGTRTYTRGTDQYIRQYSDGVQTFTIVNPEANEQLEISGSKKSLVKGDPVTVTLSWKKGRTKFFSGATYTMTVVKEDGPRVWLGDGSGNCFIIKK